MVNDFSIIEQIKLVKEKKEKLSRIEQNLSSPILTDKSLIPEIYELFKRVLSEQDFSPMPEVCIRDSLSVFSEDFSWLSFTKRIKGCYRKGYRIA